MNTRNTIHPVLLTVLQLTVILIGVLTLLFFLQRLTGDPAMVLAGHNASPEMIEAIHEEMGLDEPIYVQYAVFIQKALVMDFGESHRFQQPALDIVMDRLPATLLLSFSAIGLAILVGIPLGIYAGLYSHRPDGRFVNLLAGVLQSIPNFWLGLILLLIFSVKLQWVGSVANLEDNTIKRLALPAITLSAFYIARLIRLVRSGLLEEMAQPYVLTARAKGLTSRTVFFVHIFRNTLVPIVAFITVDLSLLIGGSVVVETLFSYSGIGDQMVRAIFNRDYAIVQATVFVIALFVVFLNLFSNYVYRVLDPRIAVRA